MDDSLLWAEEPFADDLPEAYHCVIQRPYTGVSHAV